LLAYISLEILESRVHARLQGSSAREVHKQRRFARHLEPVDEELFEDSGASPSPLSGMGDGNLP
jgi:hypothetical protein